MGPVVVRLAEKAIERDRKNFRGFVGAFSSGNGDRVDQDGAVFRRHERRWG